MERIALSSAGVAEAARALRLGGDDRAAIADTVADVVAAVRTGGDEALRRLTRRLDGVDEPRIRVDPEKIAAAFAEERRGVKDALRLLADNLRSIAEVQLPAGGTLELPHGQVVTLRPVPVDRVGVYVPGGRAAYPSSAVMAIVPAQVAGVGGIAVCTPPGASGLPPRATLAACALLGVDEVYAVGGAQGVAALALGTETIPAVDVLVGPGNLYVEEAKRVLAGEVGIESLAGPSELVVVADATAPPQIVAWDLRAQLEHGPESRSILVTADADALAAVAAVLPEGSPVTLLEADSWDTVYELVNAYAPEHLQLAVADPVAALQRVRNAGAVFMGASSGTAYGDYIAGSNHILPTGGRARFSSGLAPGAFLRMQEVVTVDAQAAAALAEPLVALARAEGFTDHARSALVRAEAAASPARAAERSRS